MQHNNNDSNNELFRRAFDGLPEEVPSGEEWKGLKEKLIEEGVLAGKQNKKILFYFIIPAIAILSFIGGYFFNEISQAELSSAVIKENHSNSNDNIKSEQPVSQREQEKGETKVKNDGEKLNKEVKETIRFNRTNSIKNNSEVFVSILPQNTNALTANNTPEQLSDMPKEKEFVKNEDTSKIADNPSVQNETSSLSISKANDQTLTPSVKDSSLDDVAVNSSKMEESANTIASSNPIDSNTLMPQKNYSKWSIGPCFSWDHNTYYEKARNSYGDELLSSDNSSLLKGNTKEFQYTIGAIVNYRFSRKMSIETGILYSQKPIVKIYSPLVGYQEDNSSWSYNDYTFHYNGKYMEIPCNFKIDFLNGRYRLYSSLGFSSVFNISGGNSYFESDKYSSSGVNRDIVVMKMKSIAIYGQVAMGCEIKIKENVGVYVEPMYQYSFNPVVKHPTYILPVDHYVRTFGLKAGVFYYLKNTSSSKQRK